MGDDLEHAHGGGPGSGRPAAPGRRARRCGARRPHSAGPPMAGPGTWAQEARSSPPRRAISSAGQLRAPELAVRLGEDRLLGDADPPLRRVVEQVRDVAGGEEVPLGVEEPGAEVGAVGRGAGSRPGTRAGSYIGWWSGDITSRGPGGRQELVEGRRESGTRGCPRRSRASGPARALATIAASLRPMASRSAKRRQRSRTAARRAGRPGPASPPPPAAPGHQASSPRRRRRVERAVGDHPHLRQAGPGAPQRGQALAQHRAGGRRRRRSGR